jgi:hypothetical protein
MTRSLRHLALLVLVGCGGGATGDDDVGDDDAAAPDAAPGTSCKRGVAYNREDAGDATALSPAIGWWYNWSPLPDADAYASLRDAGLEFVPMVWTGPPNAPIDTTALIADIPADARYLLGFNEPNFGEQANLTPAEAAAAWPQLEEIADARGLTLVSPALNYCGGNCNETDPFVWLDAFLAACDGCRIDQIAFHWYACTTDALDYILGRFEAYGRPVWLTEFACLDAADTSEPAQQQYMRDAVPILEADPQVFRYSWFIGRSSTAGTPYALLADPGQLSTLGETYVGLDGACTP